MNPLAPGICRSVLTVFRQSCETKLLVVSCPDPPRTRLIKRHEAHHVSRSFVELCLTLATTNRFTAGGKWSIVTHKRSATPGKHRTTAALLVPHVLFDQCYSLRTASVLTAAFSSVQNLSPPLSTRLRERGTTMNYL